MLKYFNFKPSFKLQCKVGNSGTLNSPNLWPNGLGNYFVSKRFAIQTLLWSLEFVVQIILRTAPLQFETWLEIEVSQYGSAAPVVRQQIWVLQIDQTFYTLWPYVLDN